MANAATLSAILGAGRNGRRSRLWIVLALTLGLFTSLIHCNNCDPAIAGNGTMIAAALDLDGSAPPDAPDHKVAGHCGHCLNHVTGQPAFVVQAPADVRHHAPSIGREQILASIAGLPLFKPPRA